MQKFLAKYGLAAHLAWLAVAPLFLSAPCVYWLTGLAAVWCFLSPSVRPGEWLHEARHRVVRSALHDPIFWISLVLMAMACARWCNDGIAMAYDAEAGVWNLSTPVFPLLPGSVSGHGEPLFAVALGLIVVLVGTRHALGKSARTVFQITAGTLSGLVALVMVSMIWFGNEGILQLAKCSLDDPSYVGAVFGVYLLAGMSGTMGAFERRWRRAIPLAALSVGGNFCGLVVFAPIWTQLFFAAAFVLLLGYCFFFARRKATGSAEFKFVVVIGLSLTLAVSYMMTLLPDDMWAAKVTAWTSFAFFPEGFWTTRTALSGIALAAWKAHLWLGTGLGSFPLDLQFYATETDWTVLQPEQLQVLNGAWQMLAERGVVGVVAIVIPLGVLLYDYVRALIGGVTHALPHPASWVGLLALIVFGVEAAFDASCLRPEMLMAVGSLLALSAKCFPKERRS